MFKKITGKKVNLMKGLIDLISPMYIKGWVKSELAPIEIHFKVNKKTSKVFKVNEYRADVCKYLKTEGNFGFTIPFDKDFYKLSVNDTFSIVAKDQKNNEHTLLYNKKKGITQKLIKSIIANKLIGREGHVDGIYENKITGWASNLVFEEQISIWLHSSSKNNPTEIICNEFRSDLEDKKINLNSGFCFDLKTLRNVKFGTYLFLSFDPEGNHKLSSENMLMMPNTDLPNNVIEIMPNKESFYSNDYFDKKIINSTDEFNNKWNKLKKYNLYINNINEFFENEINKKSKKRSFFFKIKSILGFY